MKYPHNVQIEFLDVGAAVSVGCKRLAYTDLQQMLVDLAAYVNNPAETIKVMQEQHPGLKPKEYCTRSPFEVPIPENHSADALLYATAATGSYPFPRD